MRVAIVVKAQNLVKGDSIASDLIPMGVLVDRVKSDSRTTTISPCGLTPFSIDANELVVIWRDVSQPQGE